MAKNNWTDEETRYFFQLYADERRKGNRTSIGMNKTGKDFIVKKFEERFKRGYHKWQPFKNKYDWWEQRIEEWPEARRYKGKMVPNMDMYEEEFRGVVVTGAEGWSAATGEASLSSRVDGNNDDEDVSLEKDVSVPMVETETQTKTQAGSSRGKRRRKERDVVVEVCAKRTEALEEKNRIAKQMLEREHAFSVDNVLEILNGLPEVRMWSPFHQAAVDHLLADEANRRGFMAFPRAEDKIRFLEHRIRRNLDD